MSSLPARILDDYMVCKARAYYTAHPELFKPRRVPDMEDSEKRGRAFVRNYLIPKMRELLNNATTGKVLLFVDFNEARVAYYLAYKDLEKEIVCKPDLVSIVLLRGGLLRALVFEVGDTDVDAVLRRRHVIPRILLYMVSVYLYHGVPPAGFYVSLSPKSSPPSLAIVSISGRVGLSKILENVSKLISAPEIPKPAGKPTCSHCVYTPICRFAT